jgi:hypothetical protein
LISQSLKYVSLQIKGYIFSVKNEVDIIKKKKCWVENGLNIYNSKIKKAGILLNTDNCEISIELDKVKKYFPR